jgi:hypothetical protein
MNYFNKIINNLAQEADQNYSSKSNSADENEGSQYSRYTTKKKKPRAQQFLNYSDEDEENKEEGNNIAQIF